MANVIDEYGWCYSVIEFKMFLSSTGRFANLSENVLTPNRNNL